MSLPTIFQTVKKRGFFSDNYFQLLVQLIIMAWKCTPRTSAVETKSFKSSWLGLSEKSIDIDMYNQSSCAAEFHQYHAYRHQKNCGCKKMRISCFMLCKEYVGINCENIEVVDMSEEYIHAEYLYDIFFLKIIQLSQLKQTR